MRKKIKGLETLTLTPSAPMTRSPVAVVPSSNVMVPASASTAVTLQPVLSSAGLLGPSGPMAKFLRAECRLTRCDKTHG